MSLFRSVGFVNCYKSAFAEIKTEGRRLTCPLKAEYSELPPVEGCWVGAAGWSPPGPSGLPWAWTESRGRWARHAPRQCPLRWPSRLDVLRVGGGPEPRPCLCCCPRKHLLPAPPPPPSPALPAMLGGSGFLVFNLNQKVSVTSEPTRQQGSTTQNPRWGVSPRVGPQLLSGLWNNWRAGRVSSEAGFCSPCGENPTLPKL